jgi:hypothetical protein
MLKEIGNISLFVNFMLTDYYLLLSWIDYFGLVKSQESVDIDCLSETTIIEIANKVSLSLVKLLL